MKLSEGQITKFVKYLEKAKSYEDLMSKDGVIKKFIKSSLEDILK